MSPKKFETLSPDRGVDRTANRAVGWRDTIISNAPLPILLAAMIPLRYFVEDSGWLDSYYSRMITLIGYNVILAVSLQLINGFSGQFSLGHAGFMAVGAYLAAYPAITYSRRLQDPAGVALFYLSLGLALAIGAAVLFGLFTLLRRTRKLH